MNWPDIYLLCFFVGALWSLASLLLGGFHMGHHGHVHVGHAQGHGHAHGPAKFGSPKVGHSGHGESAVAGWLGAMANPSCVAVYLCWFGGVGYLLTRHSGLQFWANLLIAIAVGLVGAWILAAFLRFLQSREQPLDAADYEMIGILGRVSSTIRAGGVGELIYVRDGARRPLAARSEDGQEIRRDEEVVVTRFEKGIAYVRTWDAMTQPAGVADLTPEKKSQKETSHV
jgi:membrane protein implicated in regulation of membrane protease activity